MKAVISKVSSCFPSSEAAQEEVVGRDDIVAQLAALQHRVDKVMIFQANGLAGCGLPGSGLSGCDDMNTASILLLVFLALMKFPMIKLYM